MERTTILSGAICTLDGKPFGKIEDIQEIELPFEEIKDDILAKLELPEGIVFECNSFKIDYNPWLADLLGIRRRKKARPVRKRLLNRLKNHYGWYLTKDYSLTPCGDGKYKCVCDAEALEVVLQ